METEIQKSVMELMQDKIDLQAKQIEWLKELNATLLADYKRMLELQSELQSINKKIGTYTVNGKRKSAVEERQKQIKTYVIDNPSPEKKGLSIESHLIKVLQLKDKKGKPISEKTVSNDLKTLGIKTILERR